MGKLLTSILVLVTLLHAGCGEEATSPPASSPGTRWPTAEARTLREGHAPTPFTADQIRQGCPSGRTSTFFTESEAEGRGFLVIRFERADAEGVTTTVEFLDEQRQRRRAPSMQRATWEQLQLHASFPLATTTVRDEVVEVPAGRFACLVYEDAQPSEGADVTTRYDFARSLPGMPIRVLKSSGGRVVSRQELVSDEPGAGD